MLNYYTLSPAAPLAGPADPAEADVQAMTTLRAVRRRIREARGIIGGRDTLPGGSHDRVLVVELNRRLHDADDALIEAIGEIDALVLARAESADPEPQARPSVAAPEALRGALRMASGETPSDVTGVRQREVK